MLHRFFPWTNRWYSQPRKARLARLCLETLEQRDVPANFQITGLHLVDGNNQLISAPVVGQQVWLRAEWNATGVPGGTLFVVRYIVDGISLDSESLSADGDGSHSWFQATTYASSGEHSAQVMIDGADLVVETNENDNTQTLTFTPVNPSDLPQKFIFPLAGTPNRDWTINNYVDVDPRALSRADYRGGPFQYDGHDALDIALPNFSAMDRGVDVLAAAGGTVVEVDDGHFDRNTTQLNEEGNFVVIDHGNGWKTYYYHLAANSLTVAVGDVIAQGQVLGLVGSSGDSTGPHLHWSVYYKNANVEINYAGSQYWVTPLPYQGDATPTVMISGISNYDVSLDLSEGPSTITVFPTANHWSVYYWYQISHFNANSQVEINWYRPDGSIYLKQNPAPVYRQSSGWFWGLIDPVGEPVGTWEVALFVDGAERDRQSFTRTSGTGVPEIRLTQGGTYILDHRTTPIDFGSVGVSAVAVERMFTINNHGSEPLTVSNLQLPAGFTLVGSFPSSVAGGATASFILRLDTTTPGLKYGEVRFTTNDADEGDFRFLIQGTITGSPPSGTPLLTLSGPAVSYGFGKREVIVDGQADISDDDAGTWNGAKLQVAFLAGATSSDRLDVRNQGTGSGQVSVSGTTVKYEGTAVGSLAGGTDTTPLTIVFDTNATLTAVRQVLRNILYTNLSTSVEKEPRFLGLTFTDADGNPSEQNIKRVTTTAAPLNDAPVLDSSRALDLPATFEDSTPAGTVVGDFAGPGIFDLDRLQTIGIAVVGASSTSGGVWQYSRDGGSTWNPFGAVSEAAARLLLPTDRVRFLPDADANGSATLTYRAWDGTQGTAGEVIAITASGGQTAFSNTMATAKETIAAVNDAPVNQAPVSVKVGKNVVRVISGLAVTDLDAGAANVQVTLSVAHGKLNLNTAVSGGITESRVVGNGTSTVTITAPLSAINATLAHALGLRYTPDTDYIGPDRLTMVSDDLNNTGSGGALTDTDFVEITVTGENQAPENTMPGPVGIDRATPRYIPGISILDVDAGNASVRVTLSVTKGRLTLLTNVSGGVTAAQVAWNNTGSITITAPLAAINATLADPLGLKYSPFTSVKGDDTLTVQSNDLGNSGPGGSKSDNDKVALLADVYVDDDWASLTPGAAIKDADPRTAWNQPAVFGVTAFASINDAIKATSGGHHVVVNAGNYSENVLIDRYVVVDGNVANASDVVIEPVAGDGITISASDVTLRDLRIRGAARGVVAAGTANLTLANLDIRDNTGMALSLTGQTGITSLCDLTLQGNGSGGQVSGERLDFTGSSTAVDDVFTVAGNSLQHTRLSGAGNLDNQAIALVALSRLNLQGGAGADLFEITPSAGGPQIGVNGGTQPSWQMDLLHVNTLGKPDLSATLAKGAYSGTWTFASESAVAFADIEQILGVELGFQQQPPALAPVGSAFTVKVQVQDENGHLLTGFNGPVTVKVQTGPGALWGATTVNSIDGVATFDNLRLWSMGTYTLKAEARGMTLATSSEILVTGTRLKFTVSPGTVKSDRADLAGFTPFTIKVEARDNPGWLARNFNGQVTLSVSSGPGTLGGTLTATAVNGVATFSDLYLARAGSYQITAQTDQLATDTTKIVATAHHLKATVIVMGPSTVAVKVEAFDANDQLATNFSGSVRVGLATGPGTLWGTLTATSTNGVAVVSGVRTSVAGTYTALVRTTSVGSVYGSNLFGLPPVILETITDPFTVTDGQAQPGVSVVAVNRLGRRGV